MLSELISIDFYYLENSTLIEYLKTLEGSEFKFNYIEQSTFDKNFKGNGNVIFFEEESYLTSLELFESIIS